ncbi:hypothetical protein DRJ00_02775 [Candidatus Aerophobetes bacterium]|uniref:Linalool dehydratase/isomerase domain-containing protein n=1 Tax=Aerophobetes bacterium TaxID=2030807 RepID=A0A497E4R8_UNCAE|nr:MAG: hypothetical protein DRJ00_02775 [Candidatus Aerophobetes bacterium]
MNAQPSGSIKRVELMPNIPSPFQMRDWKALSEAYDEFIFNFNLTGDFLPLIWWDKSHQNFERDTFGLPSYVGDVRRGRDGFQEAINCMAAVLGATLVGIDKSNQNGQNWVLMCENYYNIDNGEYLFLNTTNWKTGRSFWYEILPNILFYQLAYYYPDCGSFQEEIRLVAEKWYEACVVMGGRISPWKVPDFNWTAFSFSDKRPVYNGRWRQPDAAAGIAWLEYMAYVRWGKPEYLTAAEWSMQFLQERGENPFYEVLLPYGAYTAARMNAETGRSYDVQKLLNWCFDGDSTSRPGWGVIAERWGDYDCYGLVGSITDGGGYAFAMNTFQMAAALVPLVRYDSRFARAIGKWMLNAANAARLFYASFHDARHQSCGFWKGDPDHLIAYEGLRKVWDGKSPYATGDAIRYGWGATDFGLYGSSHVGIFGGIINRTNDEKILKLNCLKTDFYHDKAYPTYLYYNPYRTEKTVEIDVGSGLKDLYDAVTHSFLKKGISSQASFVLAADSAAVVVVVPAEGKVTYEDEKMLIDGAIVDYAAERRST